MVGHLQFMVEQKLNLVWHLILPWVFPVGQNVRCVFRLIEQILILVGHCPMSDRYFKACFKCLTFNRTSNRTSAFLHLLLPWKSRILKLPIFWSIFEVCDVSSSVLVFLSPFKNECFLSRSFPIIFVTPYHLGFVQWIAGSDDELVIPSL